ncbi:DUF7003 family protein [Micromonospora sp. I033]
MIDVEDILRQWDRAADDACFPDPDNGYYHPIDARLRCYRDDDRWALVVELVGYSPRAFEVHDVRHVFGNCLTRGEPGFGNEDFLSRVENMAELAAEEYGERYRGGVPVVVRGRPVAVDGTAGERLEDVLRRLVPAHRDLLLADEVELRERIPADLPEVLRLEEWHQPADLGEVLPSGTATYRQLAEVLATGDVGRYRPSLPPTTHWSNWPLAGTL